MDHQMVQKWGFKLWNNPFHSRISSPKKWKHHPTKGQAMRPHHRWVRGNSVRGILFEGLDGWTKTYKDRPKLLESRRPTPPVSSLPPCFPNSKGLHQVISIPIALRWEMRSKLFKSINKNLHCDTLWSFWWTLQRVQSAFKSGMSISMFSPDVGIFSCTRCMCVCMTAWPHHLQCLDIFGQRNGAKAA